MIAVPAYPPESARRHHQERLLSIIADAEPRLLLTSADLRDALQHIEGAPPLLCVDTLDNTLAENWIEPTLPQDHIAFLQYTSGSTALPKGVQVSHGNLVANELLIRHGFGIDVNPDDVIVSWLPLYHDMGLIGGLLQPIFSGVPCILMSPAYFLGRPLRWLEAISQYGGTISGGPDFAYRLCSERVSESALERLDLSRWRVAYTGSEPIRLDTLERFAEKFTPCGFSEDSFMASYGLAEATLFVAGTPRGTGIPALRVDDQALAQNRAEPGDGSAIMSCGISQPDHAVLIADPVTLKERADNFVGEVWAAGPSIAHGYWRNPEASARTFVQHAGRTWLRTGDLGFIRDGELFITGRLKDMLIVRGHNLYPQDIEQTVEREVEVVRKGRVAAFAVTQGGEEGIGIAAEISRSVQKSCRRSADQSHSPSGGRGLSGSAERGGAAQPGRAAEDVQRQAATLGVPHASGRWQPRQLRGVPVRRGAKYRIDPGGFRAGSPDRQALGRATQSQTGQRRRPLFLLGGNSIAATQVIAKVREELGLELNLRLLFEAPTLSAFAAAVAQQQQDGGSAQGEITPLSRSEALPQSLAQNRLWITWQLDPHSSAYNIPGALRLRGELDEDAVRASFQQLIERHESLRTRFFERDGVALQQVEAAPEFNLQLIDLSDLPVHEREARAQQIREDEARTQFDLEKGPLLWVTLVRLDDEDHQLLVTLHHIIADGWSLNVLIDEFSRLYAAASQGQRAELAPLPTRYADYGSWQRQWLAQGEAERQLAYWKARLGDDHPVLELATDRPRSAKQLHSAARHSVRLGVSLSDAIKQTAQAHQSTPFMLLLSAFQSLLHRYSGQRDIRIGIPNANRPRLETQGLIGFFINTQVLRAEVDSRQSFIELLAQTREAALGAQAHQDLPFEQLLEAFPQAREQGLFQVMFNHQQRDLSALKRLPGLLAEELPWHSREAKFDLQLHSEEDRNGRLTLSFDYADELFDAATIERLAEHFSNLLRSVCEHPQQAIGDLQLLTPCEHEQQQAWSIAPAPRRDTGCRNCSTNRRGRPRNAPLWCGTVAVSISPNCTPGPTVSRTTCATRCGPGCVRGNRC